MEEKDKEKHNLKTIVFDEVNGIHTQSEERYFWKWNYLNCHIESSPYYQMILV